MAVMMPREKWTDERLGDLQAEMRAGFTRGEGEIRRVDGEIKELRREMNARFEKLEARLDAMSRNQIAGFFVIVAAIIGGNAF